MSNFKVVESDLFQCEACMFYPCEAYVDGTGKFPYYCGLGKKVERDIRRMEELRAGRCKGKVVMRDY